MMPPGPLGTPGRSLRSPCDSTTALNHTFDSKHGRPAGTGKGHVTRRPRARTGLDRGVQGGGSLRTSPSTTTLDTMGPCRVGRDAANQLLADKDAGSRALRKRSRASLSDDIACGPTTSQSALHHLSRRRARCFAKRSAAERKPSRTTSSSRRTVAVSGRERIRRRHQTPTRRKTSGSNVPVSSPPRK